MNYMGPDPLEIWFNFICWYEQNVQYESQSLFETALGKCLAMYESDTRYNQDVRMVKLWMKYVSMSCNIANETRKHNAVISNHRSQQYI